MAPRSKLNPFKTEVDLCAAFLKTIDRREWTAYPETGGYDILLSRKADGFQIGIEAKLRLNPEVMNQVLDGQWDGKTGPDCRAVLVPDYAEQNGLRRIAEYIGIAIIRLDKHAEGEEGPGYRPAWQRRSYFKPALPKLEEKPHLSNWDGEGWHEWCPEKRITLPEYVPDVQAGAPSPRKLSPWKIGAIKIAILLDIRKEVTRTDFRFIGIDIRRWMPRESAWLQATSRMGCFMQGPKMPGFKAMHPVAYDKILKDFDKWAPKSPEEKQKQSRMAV